MGPPVGPVGVNGVMPQAGERVVLPTLAGGEVDAHGHDLSRTPSAAERGRRPGSSQAEPDAQEETRGTARGDRGRGAPRGDPAQREIGSEEPRRSPPGPEPIEAADPPEEARLRQLRQRDQQVRQHEMAHAAAGGSHTGTPKYRFERGADGRLYASDGDVSVDVSPVPGDPEATLRKMSQVRRAALAPAHPSSQDRAVAARAQFEITKASKALLEERRLGRAEEAGEGGDIPLAAQTFSPLARSAGGRAYLRALEIDAGPPERSVDLLACGSCGSAHAPKPSNPGQSVPP